MLSLGNKLSLTTQPIYKFVNEHSVDFDGADDRIVTDGADTVAQPTTYSFWCKSSETGSNPGVFGHGDYFIGAFKFNDGGASRPRLRLGSSAKVYWVDTSAQDDGEWHHWVVYVDPNNLNNCKLYVDAVLQTVDQVNTGSITAYTESLTIGSDRQVGGNSFSGKIDEFAVYDRELTQAEITRMYNTYYSPNRIQNGNFAQIGNEEVTNGDFSQIGSELVTNGDFATDSDWTKGANITISGGSAIFNNAVPYNNLSQNTIFQTGKTYKIEFSVSNFSGGRLIVQESPNVNPPIQEVESNGNYSVFYTATTNSGIVFKVVNGTVNMNLDNVSVKEVLQDWTFNTGWSTDGTKAISDTGSGYVNINQTTSIAINKSYKVSFTVSDYSSGNVQFIIGNSGSRPTGVLRSANGTYTEYITVDSSTVDADKFFIRGGASGFTGSIDNISVKEVGQHWTFGTGWSMGDGKAIGNITTFVNLISNATLTSGKTYKVDFTILDYVSGSLSARIGGTTGSAVTANGTYSQSIVAGSSDTQAMFRTGAFVGSIDNIVVQELKHDATNLMLNHSEYQSANPLITSTKSMEFDGVDDYLEVQDDSSLQLEGSEASWTFWTRLDSLSGGDQKFIAKATTVGGANAAYQIRTDNADLLFQFFSGAWRTVTSSSFFTDLNWVNVTVTIDASNIVRIYKNGVETLNSNIGYSIPANTGEMLFGARTPSSPTNFLNGEMTEVGIWDRTLTALEVASLYNQGVPTNLLVNRNNYQSGNPTVFNTKQVDFDGTDDYLETNKSDFLGTSDFTISGWIKPNNVNDNFIIGQSEDDNNRWYIRINTSGQLHTFGKNGGTQLINMAGSTVLSAGEWYHFVLTNDRGALATLYLNGVQVNQGTNTTTLSWDNTGALRIGSFELWAVYFDGDMSQVGIWNEVLTADEVSSLYNHGLPIDLTTDQAAYASSSNLVGYWRMGSGTLDSYPLIADQTNATLGVELSPNTNFTSNITGWENYNSGTASWSSFNAGSMKMVNDGTNNWYGRSNSLSLDTYSTYVVTAKVFLTSGYTGGDFYIYAASSFTGATDYVVKANKDITEQWQDIKYTFVTANDGNGRLYFRNGNPISSNGTTVYADDVSLKKVQGNPAYMTNMTSTDIENGSPYANEVENGTFETEVTTSEWLNFGSPTTSERSTTRAYAGSYSYHIVGDGTNDGIQATAGQFNWAVNDVVRVTAYVYPITAYNNEIKTGVNDSSRSITSSFQNLTLNQWNKVEYDVTINTAGNNYISFLIAGTAGEFYIDNVTAVKVNTGLQGYWKMGDGTNDEYPVIYDQVDPTLGSEEIVNGDFSSSDISMISGAGTRSVVNNELKIEESGAGFSQVIYNGILDTSKIYKATFDFTIGTGAYNIYDTTQGTGTLSSSGTYTYYLENTARFYVGSNGAGDVWYMDNISVKEVKGNPAVMTNMLEGNISNQYPLTKIRNYYRMGDGILDGYPIIQDQTSPNLAHIPTANVVTNSETPSFLQAITTTTGIADPFGGTNAIRLNETTANSNHYAGFSTPVVSGKNYIVSVFVKKGSYDTIRPYTQSAFMVGNATFNFNDLSISTNTTNAYVETYENDWYRLVWKPSQCTQTGNMTVYVTVKNLETYAGNTSNHVNVFGVQVEEQNQATAYLKSESDGLYAAVRKSSTTNLISYSEDFSQASQLQNVTLTANAITSPTGTSNGTKVLSSDNNSKVSYTNISFTNGTTYTLSVYCRNIDATALKFFIYNAGGGDITDDFTSQVNTTSWTRVSTTFTASQTTSSGQVQFARNLPSGESAYFWGFQLEEQTQAETYAKTTGLPVTIDLFTENNYGTMTNMSASDIVEDTP